MLIDLIRGGAKIRPQLLNTEQSEAVRPSKKKPHVSRPDFYKKESGQFFCYLLFPIACFLGVLRSNINKTKHQILIKHKFQILIHTKG